MRTNRLLLRARLTLCVMLLLMFNSQPLTAFAQGTASTLLTVFTNPVPADSDLFGSSVAAVGSDKLLIGATQSTDVGESGAGVAYLFSTNGMLLTTFTNPTPASGDGFGNSVAGVGSDKVLVGAYRDYVGAGLAGVAYLFSTNGALLTTFTNPTPEIGDRFGNSVAAVGSDKVLIGAYQDNTGATSAGAAYLFSTDGTLLRIFTNPAPTIGERFGNSVAAVGSDKVLIGAYSDYTGAGNAGAAYLFSTNGGLLTTLTNPTPAGGDRFGNSVAAVGSDKVLIGAYLDDTGAGNAGAAYLFSTNGTLLTTFTNPTPSYDDSFGSSVAAAGSDKVLITAYQDNTGATSAGAAYLFSTDGALLTTFTNPTPAGGDRFGNSVATLSPDKVLIAAYGDNTGATAAGAAYLFSFGPHLSVWRTGTNAVAVSWPSSWAEFILQENTNGLATVNWSNAPGTIQDDGAIKTLIVDPPTANRFYRLFKP